ncbi:hypothetical protein [Paenibacillus dakarensis]|uniref:hypothetical protein n=1 Tax=Paenibacillus dakarensis TaxID=1527293 RepID=UPI0006D58A8A|nr:hypothetical protein [Paenibacillus dakarensis]
MANRADIDARIAEAIETAEKVEDTGADDILRAAVNAVTETFGISCIYEYCGGFDSAGYDVDCYAIAYVTDDAGLAIYDYQYESY